MQEELLEILHRLGTGLYVQNDHITHEPLPQRWIDLLNCLNDKERVRSEQSSDNDNAPSSDEPSQK